MLKTIMIVKAELMGCFNPRSFANYNEVSFSKIMDPKIIPVTWQVIDTLEVMWACLSSFLARLSSETSWNVKKKTATIKTKAIL